MEHKNMKTSVLLEETVFSQSAEQAIDADFTLPDFCPDISKILKCRAVSRISSKGVNGRSITVEGTVTVTVIYCDEDNNLNSYEYQYPFSKNFDTGIDTDGTTLKATTKCEYINCRAVTSRKIDIHGAAGIYVKLLCRRHTDVISDVDEKNIELLRGSVPATIPMGSADKYLLVEEEIELGSGQPDIRCIIRYDASAAVKENKIIAGKSVVKGEIAVNILYSPENGCPQNVRSVIPFSQMLEMEGMTDSCSCESKVCIAYLEIKPRSQAAVGCRSFSLTAKLLVTSECSCNNDIDVILDAYSRKYSADILKEDVSFNKIVANINEVHNCKKSLEFPDGALSQISDLWCEAKTDSVKFTEGNLVINGVATAYIIALDASGAPAFFERAVDFEYRKAIGAPNNRLQCSPEICVLSCNYTLTGDSSMELRIDLNISAAVYEYSKIPLIVDIKIDEEKPVIKQNNGAMTVYFASAGESVWEIARRYCADINEVRKINDISEENLISDCAILIPTN